MQDKLHLIDGFNSLATHQCTMLCEAWSLINAIMGVNYFVGLYEQAIYNVWHDALLVGLSVLW